MGGRGSKSSRAGGSGVAAPGEAAPAAAAAPTAPTKEQLREAKEASRNAAGATKFANGMKPGEFKENPYGPGYGGSRTGRAQAYASAAGEHRTAAAAQRAVGAKDKAAKHDAAADKLGKKAAELFTPAGAFGGKR